MRIKSNSRIETMSTPRNEKSDKGLTWKDFLPIILAIPLAILVKLFIMTSYHVPTASMIPTIIPGDHILVEKWLLGPRLFINGEVYRLPGWRSVRRGDILVFNVPKEDSIFRLHRDINYYNWKKSQAGSEQSTMVKDSFQFMPIPGRTPFVKRVVGMPGDEVEYRSHHILINGELLSPHPESYQQFEIYFQSQADFDQFKDSLYRMGQHIQMNRADHLLRGIFRSDQLDFIRQLESRINTLYFIPDPLEIPKDFTWARTLAQSNIPVRIPAENWTATVDSVFLSRYGQLIRRFEGFSGWIENDKLYDEHGQQLKEYTFRQNYYWAMGDNRPFSVDSRAWGLIPEDHAIGITRRTFWSRIPQMGIREGFRWDRVWERLD